MPGLESQIKIGNQNVADGSIVTMRGGKEGEVIIQQLHGRFYEQAYRGNLFSGGITTTAITNATYTSATLSATCTPILGVWNPTYSTVNVVVLQGVLQVVITALQNTGGGPFVWATSIGNATITTGNNPFNRRTFMATGSQAKDMSNVALTGLTNNLTVRNVAGLGGGSHFNIATLATAVGWSIPLNPSTENFDGSLLIPPGGVLALLATTTPVAQSAAAALLWEEVPI